MVAKTMVDQKLCQGCSQKHECQEDYKKLANLKGTSLVFKVCIAFLLPLITFIASLAFLERVLAKLTNRQELQTVFSFLLAVLVTLAMILIVKLITKQFGKNK